MGNLLTLGVVILVLGLAVIKVWRDKKRSSSTGCPGCSGCPIQGECGSVKESP